MCAVEVTAAAAGHAGMAVASVALELTSGTTAVGFSLVAMLKVFADGSPRCVDATDALAVAVAETDVVGVAGVVVAAVVGVLLLLRLSGAHVACVGEAVNCCCCCCDSCCCCSC